MRPTSCTNTKILFANVPADGHFNPLTSLAVHLKGLGFDVRWYTSNTYANKIKRLGIPHYGFKRAFDIGTGDINDVFPERIKRKSQISKLKFDLINVFVMRAPEYYADIKAIREDFPFDIMIADCAFTGVPFVKDLMKVPVISIGVAPLMETSVDLAPNGLGLTPSNSIQGRIKQALLRKFTKAVVFSEPNKVLHNLLDQHGVSHNNEGIFDMLIQKSDYLLQSGTPGLEYYRSDLSSKVRFIGALLPHPGAGSQSQWFDQRLNKYAKIVMVTQGTVEKDITKILCPTLEAFKDSDVLVIATTGGTATDELRRKYPQKNIIIEDFIPFLDIMPYADLYITNGGYGGVMLAIQHELPMIVAGVREGRNEITARVGYFNLGVDLRTETPSSDEIIKATTEVLGNLSYKVNVSALAAEFTEYDPKALCVDYIKLLLRIPTGFSSLANNPALESMYN